jgi:dipeptidyl aminopeptidase/acylaminoacyl peptidase
MMNWIAGHNEDKLFKGYVNTFASKKRESYSLLFFFLSRLVCHDGVFSTNAVWYSTDELYFPEFEFNGPPWQARELYDKWNPEKFTDKWETPQLTIAGGKDFRLPVTEGLAAFNTLQRRGVPSRFVYFDQENHWVLEPKNSLKWHQEVLGWLLKYSAPQEKKVDNVSFVCQS